MNPEYTSVLVISIAAIVLLSVAGYFIARYLKGRIEISLPSTAFNYGETVAGSFELLARKEIQGNRLFAALIATETRRERGLNGKSHTHTEEVWRAEQQLEPARVYAAGQGARYEFKLQLPPQNFNSPDSALGQAAQFLFGGSRRINWRLEVRLDAEGVDLAASKRLSLGGSSFLGF